ncbi:MAG: Holliday junction branch migration protein RuvA [Candidatus Niyogibacteria bacterium CG10_big_fil_rev_8_21_14_0_10_42_19]|uniref:Holliday junction branch migration complex subunit RuvA n=1 Tax=Candidatus Niyogibacteria bacterium CG10_big_fil_rev_8_21_14_0_10_42_19 TaxID=1974725 RepID=A0A2H0TF36_9BACT|nr:MAG: Holliday junction branch migration protein RuvA [Candidatus Niyogibacteria bacterium CG10_big_fil_rev_8_21_14_0_10_42_19]
MISFLDGKIAARAPGYIIVDVSGVGYKVFINRETIKNLPEKDGKIKIFTTLYQREDAIELYGFADVEEVGFFETLIGISGIGPRSALGIMGVAPLNILKQAIASGETAYLTKVSGVGRKTAEKVIFELKEKLRKTETVTGHFKDEEDVLEALRGLGYSLRESREALNKIPEDAGGIDRRIKAALKILGSPK